MNKYLTRIHLTSILRSFKLATRQFICIYRQSGLKLTVGNVNPMKMAKCIMELERIKGIRSGRGGDKTSNRDNLDCSQKDLANEVGKPSNSEIISEYKTQSDLAI